MRSGSFFFALAVRAIIAPVALGLGLGMERSSLLLCSQIYFGDINKKLVRMASESTSCKRPTILFFLLAFFCVVLAKITQPAYTNPNPRVILTADTPSPAFFFTHRIGPALCCCLVRQENRRCSYPRSSPSQESAIRHRGNEDRRRCARSRGSAKRRARTSRPRTRRRRRQGGRAKKRAVWSAPRWLCP